MSQFKCTECGGEINDQPATCPQCGAPESCFEAMAEQAAPSVAKPASGKAPALIVTALTSLTIGLVIGIFVSPRRHASTVQETGKPATNRASSATEAIAANAASLGNTNSQESLTELGDKAQKGDAEAQYQLARRYYFGQGIPKDITLAAKMCRSSAEQGNASAQNLLGVLYEDGEGVTKDLVEAYKWYRKAADKGNEKANGNLSILASQGITEAYLKELSARVDLSKPEGVVKAYLLCNSWQQRLNYVRQSPTTKDAMAQVYEANTSPSAEWPVRFDPSSVRATPLSPTVKDVWKVTARFQDAYLPSEAVTYYVVRAGSEYRVDWEASQGVNSMKVLVFKATRPARPQTFRLTAELSDYYNFEFQGAQATFYSIRLHESGGTIGSASLQGYVAKNSKNGQLLFALLSDGQAHRVTLELQYLPNSQDSSITVIQRIVGIEWFIP